MENTELVTFEIRTEYFDTFAREFATLCKRARRLKVSEPTYAIVGDKVVPARINPETNVVVAPARFLKIITVSGQAPKLAGWTFVAVLQHEELGNIVHRVPGTDGVKLEKDLRTCDPYCGHCKTLRRRNDTFVVAHDDGRQLQVGRNCLRDFTGCDSPEAIARWAEFLGCFVERVNDGEDEGLGGGGGARDPHWALLTFLGVACAAIRERGWLSRTKAREQDRLGQATADTVANYLNARNETESRRFVGEIKDADCTRAAAALAYAEQHFEAAEEAGTELSDYEHNLRLIVQGGSVNFRASGLAASLVAFSERLQGREMERRRAAQSEFQGEIKQHGVWTLIVTRVIDIESEQFGVSHLHLMQDEHGNRFTWKTGTASLTVGYVYRVVGTVKEHKTWLPREKQQAINDGATIMDPGIKQTVLTRCNTDQLTSDEAGGAAVWTIAADKRVALETELAAKVRAAKEAAKAAKKAAKAAKAAEKDSYQQLVATGVV